jgi:hypothetical protein
MPTAGALALEEKVLGCKGLQRDMPADWVTASVSFNERRAGGGSSSQPKRDVSTEQDSKKSDAKKAACASSLCVVCGATASKHCAACGTVKYCSRECQTGHWKQHKAACRAAAPREQEEWTESNQWAKGLKLADRYEWLCNCYQMRCDDDYAWGGARCARSEALSSALPRVGVGVLSGLSSTQEELYVRGCRVRVGRPPCPARDRMMLPGRGNSAPSCGARPEERTVFPLRGKLYAVQCGRCGWRARRSGRPSLRCRSGRRGDTILSIPNVTNTSSDGL